MTERIPSQLFDKLRLRDGDTLVVKGWVTSGDKLQRIVDQIHAAAHSRGVKLAREVIVIPAGVALASMSEKEMNDANWHRPCTRQHVDECPELQDFDDTSKALLAKFYGKLDTMAVAQPPLITERKNIEVNPDGTLRAMTTEALRLTAEAEQNEIQ